jgi:hypothetical protein
VKSQRERRMGGEAGNRCSRCSIPALLAFSLSLVASAQTIVPLKGTSLDADVIGNLYILDGERCTLTVVDTNYVVRAEVGGPGGRPGEFDHPDGIWARNGLDIYVADYGNHRIQRFDRTLAFVSSFSTRDDDGSLIRFGYPRDVALSRLGDLFIVDGENQRIVRTGGATGTDGSFGGFDAGSGKLNQPSRIAVGPSDGIYVVDGSRIIVFDAFGNFLTSLYEDMWKAPVAIYGDGGQVIVADDTTLFWFGKEHQLLGKVRPLGEAQSIGGVRDITYSNGKLFLLGKSGLAILADPFSRARND